MNYRGKLISLSLAILITGGMALQAATTAPATPAETAAPDAAGRIAAYQGRIDRLRASTNENVIKFLPTAEGLLLGLRSVIPTLPANGISFTDKGVLKDLVSELDLVLPELEAGRNPYVKHPGTTLVVYRSPLDGRLLAVRIILPAGYDPETAYPLTFSNGSSGDGQKLLKPDKIRISGPGPAGQITAGIQDRGGCHFANDIHEQESLEAVAALGQMFKLDPLRIVKSGGSKDGYSSIIFGMHFPHLYAAAVCYVGVIPDKLIAYRPFPFNSPPRMQLECLLMGENMYSLPSAAAAGLDGNHLGTLMLGAMWDKIGAPNKLVRVEPETAHGIPAWTMDEIKTWQPLHKLDPYPRRVYVSTSTLRYNKFYWVEVDALERENHFARMRVDALADNRIEIDTHNAARFSLVTLDKVLNPAKPATVEIDDQAIPNLTPGKDGRLSFQKTDGRWAAVAERHDPGLVKKAGLCGPMMDGWITPAIHVIGTLGGPAETQRLRNMMATEVRYWRNEQCGARLVDHPVKLDTEVTADDIRDCHLILWGNDRTNALIRKINPSLPMRLDGQKVLVGDRTYDYDDTALAMIYPNPLNPERYAMIFSGNTWMGVDLSLVQRWSADKATKTIELSKITDGYPLLPDYFIFRQNRVSLGMSFGSTCEKFSTSVLEGGFFDAHWKLSRDDAFSWRNKMEQKNAPLTVLQVVSTTDAPPKALANEKEAAPVKMTATPGTLDLGFAQEQDGLLYQFSAAHYGRYFSRDYGSVSVTQKLIVLEVLITNKSKGPAFVYPLQKNAELPALELDGKTIPAHLARPEQSFGAIEPGESIRLVLWYNADPSAAKQLTIKNVGLQKALTLRAQGNQLQKTDYNPEHFIEGAIK